MQVDLIYTGEEVDLEDRPDLARDRRRRIPHSLRVAIDRKTAQVEIEDDFGED